MIYTKGKSDATKFDSLILNRFFFLKFRIEYNRGEGGEEYNLENSMKGRGAS